MAEEPKLKKDEVRVQGTGTESDGKPIVYIGQLTDKSDDRVRYTVPHAHPIARIEDFTPSRGSRDRGIDYTLFAVCEPEDRNDPDSEPAHAHTGSGPNQACFYLVHERRWSLHDGEAEVNDWVFNEDGYMKLTAEYVSRWYPALARAGHIEIMKDVDVGDRRFTSSSLTLNSSMLTSNMLESKLNKE